MSKDYYQILGVSKDASDEEIKKAFRRLAHEHHPDKGGDQQKFKDVNAAYQVLGDKQKRAAYDRFGSAAFEQGGSPGGPSGFGGFEGFGGFDFGQGQDFGDLGDILGQMFGFGHPGRGRGHSQGEQGKAIEVEVALEFREAIFGVERSIRLYRHATCSRCHGNGAEPGTNIATCATCQGSGQVRHAQHTPFGTIQMSAPCNTCHGQGKKPEKPCTLCRGVGVERREEEIHIEIPPGISDGETLRVSGQGEAAPHGGRSGDLYVHIRVKKDPVFRREGNDLHSELPVSYSLLALGGKMMVKTVHGEASLSIPEGTPSGTVFRLRGEGAPSSRGRGRGDHHVRVVADIPKKLSKEQKHLIEQLKETGL